MNIKTYSTSEIAEIIGVHPNTVRMYEEWGFIPKAERKENGYRIFTDFHIAVFRLARTAFQVEVLQNGLRKKSVEIVKATAECEINKALNLSEQYLIQIRSEQENAAEAIAIVKQILSDTAHTEENLKLKRKTAAKYLQVSVDTLRNWEMNGLLNVKRSENGYRIYTDEDLRRLKIIRSLRCANYSLEAILRMLHALSADSLTDLETVLDTPPPHTDIISVCDRLLTSLKKAERNAEKMRQMLLDIKKDFDKPSI